MRAQRGYDPAMLEDGAKVVGRDRRVGQSVREFGQDHCRGAVWSPSGRHLSLAMGLILHDLQFVH